MPVWLQRWWLNNIMAIRVCYLSDKKDRVNHCNYSAYKFRAQEVLFWRKIQRETRVWIKFTYQYCTVYYLKKAVPCLDQPSTQKQGSPPRA